MVVPEAGQKAIAALAAKPEILSAEIDSRLQVEVWLICKSSQLIDGCVLQQQGMVSFIPTQEGDMANWISCTIPSGNRILVNFDNATSIRRNDLDDQTQISFLGEEATLVVRETIKQLSEAGLMT